MAGDGLRGEIMEALIADLVGPQGLSYIILFLVGALTTFPWRWAGVLLSTNLKTDSEFIKWVKAVSMALVAALIGRMLLFPGGELAHYPLVIRLAAFVVGLIAFYALGRVVIIGIGAGVSCLAVLGLML